MAIVIVTGVPSTATLTSGSPSFNLTFAIPAGVWTGVSFETTGTCLPTGAWTQVRITFQPSGDFSTKNTSVSNTTFDLVWVASVAQVADVNAIAVSGGTISAVFLGTNIGTDTVSVQTFTMELDGTPGGGGGGGGSSTDQPVITPTPDTSGYDPITAICGSGLGCCGPGLIPCNCRPTTIFTDAASAVTANSAPLVFVSRGDRYMISLVDTITPCFVSCMRYYSHPAQFVAGEAKRAVKARVIRMIVYGSGVITDGTLTVVADNRYTETYPAIYALSQEPGVLFYQEFTGAMVGTSIAPDLVLSGTGIDITDIEFEGVRIDS